jgi:hypothetical protein
LKLARLNGKKRKAAFVIGPPGFRVCAAMNLTAAKVPAVIIMLIGLLKTMTVFLRYNIYDKAQAKKSLLDGAEYVASQLVA